MMAGPKEGDPGERRRDGEKGLNGSCWSVTQRQLDSLLFRCTAGDDICSKRMTSLSFCTKVLISQTEIPVYIIPRL
ncbi:hypothetical protein MLD38_037083 [Melastoma candidum]|uniref:Uncharacterized protein n=1 Tax=Melastoma candidum TaxID=119954 RepID=A0ACB9LMV9_9MYRT|nr:hypothetical protein MLD38_037083 [Melastoma candidum]